MIEVDNNNNNNNHKNFICALTQLRKNYIFRKQHYITIVNTWLPEISWSSQDADKLDEAY